MTKWLLIINIVVFLADVLSVKYFPVRVLTEEGMEIVPYFTFHGTFSVGSGFSEGHLWKLITFQFLHGSVGHILFNSIALYFFGPIMERWWGTWKFLAFYLISGIGGALLYSLLGWMGIIHLGPGIIGASAGIFGILIGTAVIAPNARIALLFPPIELAMRTFALAILGIAVFSIAVPIFGNEGGDAGHLGGAIFGFILIKFPRLLGWIGRRNPDVDIIRPRAFQQRGEPKLRPRSQVNLRGDTEIDRILDKVSSEGFASLTDEERAKLHAEHERLQRGTNTDH
ncbi:rhomboid family intramembrane serine protease [Luteolibacter sp. SL250]|uniref:rhomboid family intramembrane serine protease n=1 Tax=Luteolibacter sp. SL250 TaxID=2995170 RepID=UPI0022717780|nr:rhomboid family intramembrane serine protease [Luteolibacter sp. SL250]WAC19711.1 rhomboid family intramembrane serine protease [Luteolibacter sp. SL250]